MSLKKLITAVAVLVLSASASLVANAEDAIVKYYGDVVYVTGSFTEADAGKEALLLLVPEDSKTDFSTAAYMNECIVAEDGSYAFKFKVTQTLDDSYIMRIKLQGEDVAEAQVIEKLDSDKVVELIPEIDSAGNLSLGMKNYYFDSFESAKVIAVEYDSEGAMIKTVMTDYSLAFDTEKQSVTFAETLSSKNKIKVFLWKGLSGLTPITEPATIPVSVN